MYPKYNLAEQRMEPIMLDDSAAGAKTPNERAEYIERMSHELSRLATVSGLPFLTYILNMAAEEASHSKVDLRFAARGRAMAGADLDMAKLRRQK